MFIVIWLVVSLYHDLIDLADEFFEIGSIAGIFRSHLLDILITAHP